ncbi:MAG: alpha/beta hydrolase family protein [Limisphaerales bacterium]
MKLPRIIFICLFFCGFSRAGKETKTTRLDRTNLLLYHTAAGEIKQGKTLGDWKKRRAEILKGMQEVMGPLPGKEKRCPLDFKIQEETDCGSYLRQKITYAAEPNGRVPAYLLIPKKALMEKIKCPAVLCLHPTDMQLGYKTIVGLGGKEYPHYARELTERGFVALVPSYPLMAEYQPDLKSLGYQSGTMKAIWDNIRGLDLLESLPYVKRNSFGAIGHSLGGHNSIYTAVFDKRIKVIISSCGFDSYLDYMNGKIQGWTSERYMPKLLNYPLAEIPFDFHELIGALAPRVCFINAPLQDGNFKWSSVEAIVTAAKPIYKLYGAKKNLRVEHPNCAHDFPDEMRNLAYEILDKNLK